MSNIKGYAKGSVYPLIKITVLLLDGGKVGCLKSGQQEVVLRAR